MSGSMGYSPAVQGGTASPQMAGVTPGNMLASPTQQMSVADQLDAVGIPMNGKGMTGGGLQPSTVTPPPMVSQSTSGGGGGGSGAQDMQEAEQAIGTVATIAALL